MKQVTLYKLQNDGAQKTILKCFLDNEIVSFEGENINFIKNIKTKGIKCYTDKNFKVVLPSDGLIFLENLKHNFNSGYLNASDVEEKW